MDLKENAESTKESEELLPVSKKKSRLKNIAIIGIILLLTNIFSIYAGSVIALPIGQKVMINKEDASKFGKLFEVWDDLHKLYFGDLDEAALLEGAIKGMTTAVNDPYTVFMNKKEFSDFSTQTEGNYVGIGLNVGVKDDKITIISSFENSPAAKAGITTGDIIEKVNDIVVEGKDLEIAVNNMRGKKDEDVRVTIFREGKGSKEYTMKRAVIILETVKGEMLDKTIGYVNISMFDVHTGTDFNKKLKELMSKGMKGLILDLRGNPGGLLTTCNEVVSNFVEKNKVIVSTKDKNGNEKKYNSQGGIAIGMPLVVLTDDGTASASEIVSGTIRDYKLGTLIGIKTFGKGVVQTVVDTKDGTALKVTISKYYTPNGENIHKTGIKPDIEVQYPAELKEKPYNRDVDPQFKKALEVIRNKAK